MKTSAGGKQGRCSKGEQRIRIAADLDSIWLSEEETAGTSTPSLKPDDTAGTLVARELKTTPSHYAAAGGNSLTEDYGRQLYCFMAMLIASATVLVCPLTALSFNAPPGFFPVYHTWLNPRGLALNLWAIFLGFSQVPAIILALTRGQPLVRSAFFFFLTALLPGVGLVPPFWTTSWVLFMATYGALRWQGWEIKYGVSLPFGSSQTSWRPARLHQRRVSQLIWSVVFLLPACALVWLSPNIIDRPAVSVADFLTATCLALILYFAVVVVLPGLRRDIRGALVGLVSASLTGACVLFATLSPVLIFAAGAGVVFLLSRAGILRRSLPLYKKSSDADTPVDTELILPVRSELLFAASILITCLAVLTNTALIFAGALRYRYDSPYYVFAMNGFVSLLLIIAFGYLVLPVLPARLSFFFRSLRIPWWRRVRGESATERAASGYAGLATFGLRLLDSERLMKGLLVGAAVLVFLRWLAYLR